MMKKTVKLYNVMMPIWLMLLFPTYLWLLILPVNFLIDSLVVAITASVRRIGATWRVWKASILLCA